MEIVTSYFFDDDERRAILQTRDLMKALGNAGFVLANHVARELDKILNRESANSKQND